MCEFIWNNENLTFCYMCTTSSWYSYVQPKVCINPTYVAGILGKSPPPGLLTAQLTNTSNGVIPEIVFVTRGHTTQPFNYHSLFS